jgi:hypothetical protein
LAVPVLVLWVVLEKKLITKLGCLEIFFKGHILSTAGDPLSASKL